MPAGLKPFYRGFELLSLCHNIKTAFGCNFLTFFWNEAHLVRHDPQRNVDNLFGVAHFEIQFCHDVCAQPFDVAILNVAAIGAQMGDDSAGASPLANTRRHEWIRLGIFRFRHRGVTRLTQRRHMIDVDSQTQTTHLIAPNRTQPMSLSKSENCGPKSVRLILASTVHLLRNLHEAQPRNCFRACAIPSSISPIVVSNCLRAAE